MKNLQELPKFRDGLSYIYVEHGRIEQEDKAVAWWSPEGIVAIPAAALGVLFLGPGTTITHAAVKSLSECGCTICWVGEDQTRFYAAGTGETRSSAGLLRQAEALTDPARHLQIVRRLYAMRFHDTLPPDLELAQIRGLEGVRVRDAYARASRETGVPWQGRNYDRSDWASSDPINRALSAGTSCLYGVCHAAIVSAGYSPALGFIHTGKQLSFVYDIADLYKVETVVPAAFEATATSDKGVEGRTRQLLRDRIKTARILERAVDDLHRLFEPLGEQDQYAADGARPGDLWEPEGMVPGGVAYGCDGVGESSAEPARGVDEVDD
ncbi:MAG: type I-E CRISPR-associated endonuclease Cas1e [Candidatus Bipolaricaulis sp.]|nr:type I-E CRISPR-associated endonuclease Cas1e [Candidatus Bipolaricaulis sp.]